jgi:ATP-dependent Clp protease protease subunit
MRFFNDLLHFTIKIMIVFLLKIFYSFFYKCKIIIRLYNTDVNLVIEDIMYKLEDENQKIDHEHTFTQTFIEKELFKSRIILLYGEMNPDLSKKIVSQLLALASINDEDIKMYINSPGGHVESGDSIYDLIQFIKPTVKVIGTGYVASIATHIYLAAKLENRYCLPNTRFLIHQPMGGSRGQASDIEIQAKQILETKKRINAIIAERTGQPLAKVEQDTERDFWLSPDEAIKYGILGKVIRSVKEI